MLPIKAAFFPSDRFFIFTNSLSSIEAIRSIRPVKHSPYFLRDLRSTLSSGSYYRLGLGPFILLNSMQWENGRTGQGGPVSRPDSVGNKTGINRIWAGGYIPFSRVCRKGRALKG